MPSGQANIFPSGFWTFDPSTQKLSTLIFKNIKSLAIVSGAVFAILQYRSLNWKYTHKAFIGKTMTFGQLSVMTHEPLSVAEIDRLKEQQAERKKNQTLSN